MRTVMVRVERAFLWIDGMLSHSIVNTFLSCTATYPRSFTSPARPYKSNRLASVRGSLFVCNHIAFGRLRPWHIPNVFHPASPVT